MPFSDTIQHLDARIRATVEKTVTDLRQELLDRLQSQSQQLREQVEALAPELPDVFLPSEDIDRALAEAAAVERERARSGAIRELSSALGQLDAARTQADLLGALLTEAGRHASRTAVFLAEPGRLRGWGGNGFGDAEERLRGCVLEGAAAAGVGRVLEGRGVVRMSSADRIRLSSELEISVPGEALLIPLVLRDRVAGALYADRLETAVLTPEVLQILTHVAALSLETLPLRRRPSTPTLSFDDEVAEAGGLAVWGGGGAAPAAPARPEGEEPSAAAAEIPATPEPEAATPEPEAPDVELEEVDLDDVDLDDADLEEVDLEEVDLEEVDLEEVEFEEMGEADEGFATSEATEPGVAGAGGFETGGLEVGAVVEAPAEEAVREAPSREPREEAAFVTSEPEAPAEVQSPEVEVELEEEVAAEPPPVVEAPPPPPPRPVSEIRPPGGGSQVQPPSDVQGPGWAFSADSQRDSDDEARHHEAQRLARLLVSEIKLYNEEQVNEGRRNHDVFERLKEDIERSRQLYESRVDAQVREANDYFYQEMVRVLGAGDPKTLGI